MHVSLCVHSNSLQMEILQLVHKFFSLQLWKFCYQCLTSVLVVTHRHPPKKKTTPLNMYAHTTHTNTYTVHDTQAKHTHIQVQIYIHTSTYSHIEIHTQVHMYLQGYRYTIYNTAHKLMTTLIHMHTHTYIHIQHMLMCTHGHKHRDT